MNALIGDRFLKRFIGRRPTQHTGIPAWEAQALPEYTAEKPAEQVCPSGQSLPMEEAKSENKQKDESNQIQNVYDGLYSPSTITTRAVPKSE